MEEGGVEELFTIHVQVIKSDTRNENRMAPVRFPIERIGLVPEPPKVRPEQCAEEPRYDRDLNPGGATDSQKQRIGRGFPPIGNSDDIADAHFVYLSLAHVTKQPQGRAGR